MNFYAEAIWRDVKRNAVAFWFHPTINEMQAQMLREVPWILNHRLLAQAMLGSSIKTMASTMALIKEIYGEKSQ